TASDAVQKDLQQQQQILTDRNAPDTLAQQQLREEAARRLVSRASREADEILLRVLGDFGNRPGQLAVAKALSGISRAFSGDQTLEDSYVKALANLLGDDREMTEKAATALATFKNSEQARAKLTGFVDNLIRNWNTRAAVIRAMGRLIDKRTAGFLVTILTRENENPLVRDAAARALEEMTGLRFGNDAQLWSQWWETSKKSTDLEWATDLLYKYSVRAGEGWRRLDETREFATRLMRDEYQDRKTAEAERVKRLIGYLRSNVEDVRLAAVQIIYDDALSYGGTRIASEVLETLRKMVGDSSTDVRMRVARTLTTANDPGAVDALLAQLSQEKDLGVQAAILAALGPSQDLRSVPELLSRLSDPNTPYSVASASAQALRDLAPTLRDEENADLALKVAQQLRARLGSTTGVVSAAKLRENLVVAMSKLGHRSSMPVFYELLNPRESIGVRIAAINGLGLIGDPGAANMIVNMLNDDQQGVRLAAAEALQRTASFANAEAIARHLSQTVERDPTVRETIWKVLSKLFQEASVSELFLWSERFKGDNEADLTRRIRLLTVLEEKLASSRDDRNLAMVRQTHGEVLLKLSRIKSEPTIATEAAGQLREALDYWMSHNATEAEINMPRQQYMQALLQAGKDSEAATFAATLITANNKSALGDIWRNVNEEVTRRRRGRNLDGALALIEVVKKLPWGAIYEPQLKSLEDGIRKERGAGGQIWWTREFPQCEYALLNPSQMT
ncbi:MAG: HEAT repeat domain-containing protein, partial [Bacillota bacterium]